jgi:hypothetical protein
MQYIMLKLFPIVSLFGLAQSALFASDSAYTSAVTSLVTNLTGSASGYTKTVPPAEGY